MKSTHSIDEGVEESGLHGSSLRVDNDGVDGFNARRARIDPDCSLRLSSENVGGSESSNSTERTVHERREARRSRSNVARGDARIRRSHQSESSVGGGEREDDRGQTVDSCDELDDDRLRDVLSYDESSANRTFNQRDFERRVGEKVTDLGPLETNPTSAPLVPRTAMLNRTSLERRMA